MRHDKGARLLELARRLASSAEGLTLDEMAEAMEVGRRTAERMRDALFPLFPELEEVRDGPNKRFRIRNGLDGLFQAPSLEELAELGMAASALRGAGAAPRAALLETLERKVRSALRASTLRRIAPDVEALVRAEAIAVQAGPHPFEDPAIVGAIRDALIAMRRIAFRYAGGRTPGRRREVVPYGLMFGRANYLVAAEAENAEPRNWRLDRIEGLEALDSPGAPPPDFSLRDYADRSFGIYQDAVEDVALHVTPEGAADALAWRFHPSQTLETCLDGSVIVRFRASGMLELAWHLFTWGRKVRVLAPERLRAVLEAELESALAWHRAGEREAVGEAGAV